MSYCDRARGYLVVGGSDDFDNIIVQFSDAAAITGQTVDLAGWQATGDAILVDGYHLHVVAIWDDAA
jgi:hypothetical protein